MLMGDGALLIGKGIEDKISKMHTLYGGEFNYLKAALNFLRESEPLQVESYPEEQRLDLTATEDLKQRYRFLPKEIWPKDGAFILSADRNEIQKEIKRSRKDENAWPRIHYLWPLHPVIEWVNDKAIASFGRHEAPVVTLQGALDPGELVFVLSGLIPNRKGQPLIHRWFSAVFIDDHFRGIEEFESTITRVGLGKKTFPNVSDNQDIEALQRLLPEALDESKAWMSEQRKDFEEKVNEKLNNHLAALERLREKQYAQLEFRFSESQQPEKIIKSKKEKNRREIDRIFDEYFQWVEDTMTTEDNPYIQVIAVLRGINQWP